MPVKGLDKVIISAGFHAGDDVILCSHCRKEQHVGVFLLIFLLFTKPSGDLHAVNARHHPVKNRKLRRIFSLKRLPCLVAVVCDHHLVTPFSEHVFKHHTGSYIIFSNQNFHNSSIPSFFPIRCSMFDVHLFQYFRCLFYCIQHPGCLAHVAALACLFHLKGGLLQGNRADTR